MSLQTSGIIKGATDALITAQPEINKVTEWGYDFSPEFADAGDTVQVAIVNATGSVYNELSNNFETADGNITYADVKLDSVIKATLKWTGKDLAEDPNAPYYVKMGKAAGEAVKAGISQKIGELLGDDCLSANTAVLSTVTKKSLAGLRSKCAGKVAETVLVLSPDYYAEMLSLFDSSVYGSDEAVKNGYCRIYGFANVIEGQSLPNGIVGALVQKDALAFASRALRIADEGSYSEVGTVTDDSGLTLTVMRHGSPATNSGFLNVVCPFGGTIVKPNEIKILKGS